MSQQTMSFHRCFLGHKVYTHDLCCEIIDVNIDPHFQDWQAPTQDSTHIPDVVQQNFVDDVGQSEYPVCPPTPTYGGSSDYYNNGSESSGGYFSQEPSSDSNDANGTNAFSPPYEGYPQSCPPTPTYGGYSDYCDNESESSGGYFSQAPAGDNNDANGTNAFNPPYEGYPQSCPTPSYAGDVSSPVVQEAEDNFNFFDPGSPTSLTQYSVYDSPSPQDIDDNVTESAKKAELPAPFTPCSLFDDAYSPVTVREDDFYEDAVTPAASDDSDSSSASSNSVSQVLGHLSGRPIIFNFHIPPGASVHIHMANGEGQTQVINSISTTL